MTATTFPIQLLCTGVMLLAAAMLWLYTGCLIHEYVRRLRSRALRRWLRAPPREWYADIREIIRLCRAANRRCGLVVRAVAARLRRATAPTSYSSQCPAPPDEQLPTQNELEEEDDIGTHKVLVSHYPHLTRMTDKQANPTETQSLPAPVLQEIGRGVLLSVDQKSSLYRHSPPEAILRCVLLFTASAALESGEAELLVHERVNRPGIVGGSNA